jgi:hypothetical protein
MQFLFAAIAVWRVGCSPTKFPVDERCSQFAVTASFGFPCTPYLAHVLTWLSFPGLSSKLFTAKKFSRRLSAENLGRQISLKRLERYSHHSFFFCAKQSEIGRACTSTFPFRHASIARDLFTPAFALSGGRVSGSLVLITTLLDKCWSSQCRINLQSADFS